MGAGKSEASLRVVERRYVLMVPVGAKAGWGARGRAQRASPAKVAGITSIHLALSTSANLALCTTDLKPAA